MRRLRRGVASCSSSLLLWAAFWRCGPSSRGAPAGAGAAMVAAVVGMVPWCVRWKCDGGVRVDDASGANGSGTEMRRRVVVQTKSTSF